MQKYGCNLQVYWTKNALIWSGCLWKSKKCVSEGERKVTIYGWVVTVPLHKRREKKTLQWNQSFWRLLSMLMFMIRKTRWRGTLAGAQPLRRRTRAFVRIPYSAWKCRANHFSWVSFPLECFWGRSGERQIKEQIDTQLDKKKRTRGEKHWRTQLMIEGGFMEALYIWECPNILRVLDAYMLV